MQALEPHVIAGKIKTITKLWRLLTKPCNPSMDLSGRRYDYTFTTSMAVYNMIIKLGNIWQFRKTRCTQNLAFD